MQNDACEPEKDEERSVKSAAMEGPQSVSLEVVKRIVRKCSDVHTGTVSSAETAKAVCSSSAARLAVELPPPRALVETAILANSNK